MCGRMEIKETPYIFNFRIRLRFKCPSMFWALYRGQRDPDIHWKRRQVGHADAVAKTDIPFVT